MNYKRLGVVGGGNMAQAIVSNAMNQVVWGDEICIASPHLSKLGLLRNQGVKLTTDNREAVAFGDIVLLAVRPQVLESVLDQVADLLEKKTVVSIVQGYGLSWLQQRLPQSNIICALPNGPVTLGKGATAITPMGDVPERDYRFVSSVFLCCGGLFVVPAEKLNGIIPVSVFSPALFYEEADMIAKQAAQQGVEYNMALMMVAQSMAGAAQMLMKAGRTPGQLKQQACVHEMTSMAGLTAIGNTNLQGVIEQIFARCMDRVEELGK